MTRMLGVGAALALAAGGLLAVAPAAHAADTLDVDVDCTVGGTVYLPQVTVHPGDTVKFNATNGTCLGAGLYVTDPEWPGTVAAWGGYGTSSDFALLGSSGPDPTVSSASGTPAAWLTISGSANSGALWVVDGESVLMIFNVPEHWDDPNGVYQARITVVALPSTSASFTAATPADEMQQVPVPSSGSCADVVDADLRWGTQVSGGWSKSWAGWAHAAVCTRTLYYNTSTASWAVR